MLARCWASVWDAAPASSQQWSAFIPFVPSTVQSKRKYSSCMRVALTKLQVEQINIVPTIYKNDYMRGGLYTWYMHTSITKLVTWLLVLFFFQYQCLYGRFLINTTKPNNSSHRLRDAWCQRRPLFILRLTPCKSDRYPANARRWPNVGSTCRVCWVPGKWVSEWILLHVAFCTIMAISRQKAFLL